MASPGEVCNTAALQRQVADATIEQISRVRSGSLEVRPGPISGESRYLPPQLAILNEQICVFQQPPGKQSSTLAS
jgi:hypothetical protein